MDGLLVIVAFVLCIAVGALGYQVGKDNADSKWMDDCTYLKSHVHIKKDTSRVVIGCEVKP